MQLEKIKLRFGKVGVYSSLAILSLSSTLYVVAFGYKSLDPEIYAFHLQLLAVLSVAGLFDYFYINRIERACVKHFELIEKALLKKNWMLMLLFFISVIGFLYDTAFFLSIVLLRHFINLRRGAFLISGSYVLSYFMYVGQIFRNLMVSFGDVDLELYKLLVYFSFSAEVIYLVIKGRGLCGEINFASVFPRVGAVLGNHFQYRLFYLSGDFIFRFLTPFFIPVDSKAQYVFYINMLVLPVAAFSVFGALVHAYLIRKSKFFDIRYVYASVALCMPFAYVVYSILGIELDFIFLLAFVYSACCKLVQQVCLSYWVSDGMYSKLRNIFLLTTVLGVCLAWFASLFTEYAIETMIAYFFVESTLFILYFSVDYYRSKQNGHVV